MGSVEFSKKLIKEAQVAVAPGLGFGEYVCFALIESNTRISQAVRGIRKIMSFCKEKYKIPQVLLVHHQNS